MSWLKNVLGGVSRTLGTWLNKLADWFSPKGTPCDGKSLHSRAESILHQSAESVWAAPDPKTWSDWAHYSETLIIEGGRLVKRAGQEVVNKGADPITEYISVPIALAFILYRTQRDLPGDRWEHYSLLEIASIVTNERIASADWDSLYRAWAARGLKDAKTISHVGMIEKEIPKLLKRVVQWCQSRAAEDEMPEYPSAQQPVSRSEPAESADKADNKNTASSPTDRKRWDQVEFREYMERIRRGEKLPIDEQAQVIEKLLGSPEENERAEPTLLRGLAGTGKTVMLALVMPELAARFHRTHGRPPRILVYHFNNYLRRTLRREFGQAMKNARVLYALGARPEMCYAHLWGLSWMIANALGQASPPGTAREVLLPELLRLTSSPQWRRFRSFDIILVDEGQDLLSDEYRLLAACLSENGRLIVAFDDFQNVMSGDAKPVRERLMNAMPGIFPKTVSLTTCVRSNPVVFSTALSTLLGPSLTDPEQRKAIRDAIALDSMIDAGVIEEIPWPDHSGFDLYGARFCFFPEGPPPRIVAHPNEAALHNMVLKTLRALSTQDDGRPTLRMTVLIISIVNAVLERMTKALVVESEKGTLPPVRLRSGPTIESKTKRETEVVAPGVINLANVNDAKGAEADIVFVIDPDCPESGASALKKRALFYVAATRAKVLLQIDGIKHEETLGPILSDARAVFDAFDMLTKDSADGQKEARLGDAEGRSSDGDTPDPSGHQAGKNADNPRPLDAGVVVPAALSVVTGIKADAVTQLTRFVDAPGTNLVDQWMDQVPGHEIAGGFGHRFLNGHSLVDVFPIYQEYGLNGVWDFAQHMGRDLCTPHGLPLPGGPLVFETLNRIPGIEMDLGTAIDWFCVNIADLLSGSLAGLSLLRLSRQSSDPTTMFVASGVKFVFGMFTTNPLILIGAMVGTGIAVARVVRTSTGDPGMLNVPRGDDAIQLYDTLRPLDVGRLTLAAREMPKSILVESSPLRFVSRAAPVFTVGPVMG